MFQAPTRPSALAAVVGLSEVIFHSAVRNVRKSHGSPVIGLLMNILQSVIMLAVFFLMLDLFGARRSAVRGDFLLYIMTGVFMFMTHVKALGAVAGADGPTSPMMKHAPMNTIVAIGAAALSALYLQFLSAAVILMGYHTLFTPITIDEPVGALAMMLVAWITGVAIGMILQAAKPWWPEGVTIITTVYQRLNMVFSGKMFLANVMPGYLLPWFWWNPLFHTIDQTRGYVFLNYTPHYTSVAYPLQVAAALAVIGLMAEFYTRRHASASWMAGK